MELGLHHPADTEKYVPNPVGYSTCVVLGLYIGFVTKVRSIINSVSTSCPSLKIDGAENSKSLILAWSSHDQPHPGSHQDFPPRTEDTATRKFQEFRNGVTWMEPKTKC